MWAKGVPAMSSAVTMESSFNVAQPTVVPALCPSPYISRSGDGSRSGSAMAQARARTAVEESGGSNLRD